MIHDSGSYVYVHIIVLSFWTVSSEEVTCDEEYDQCWITVFGFPPSASSYILDQFSQYGNIIQHRVCMYTC